MKNVLIVAVLLLCTVLIVTINYSYLKKNVLSWDDQDLPVSDQPTVLKKRPATSPSLTTSSRINESVMLGNSTTEAKILKQPLKGEATAENTESKNDGHRVAGLNCDKYGGPSEDIAAEMVYWEDIPVDADFVSPYANYGKSPKYLTFEPDEGGWNNIRMSMETATVMAQAMGRILVLPPEQDIYLLWNDRKNQKNNKFTFKDFFHFDSIADEHPAVEVISMEEFYRREALVGNLHSRSTGAASFPPNNETEWNGHGHKGRKHWMWLREVAAAPIWFFDNCVATFPAKPGPEGLKSIEKLEKSIPRRRSNWMRLYDDNPTEVDAEPEARLLEMLGTRRKMCVYNEALQNEKVIHFMGDNASGARLLVHFYAFLFFEDYHHDLWTKRFVRDHLRYIDEIQCAAARIVHAVRQKAIENGDPKGLYDSMHVRRGDFQYKETRISAEEIYNNTRDLLLPNATVFIATDERDKSFFDPMRKHYHLLFLDDFKDLFEGLNMNYMGMLDQRVASRGRSFVGAYYSTFTGYIARMRGYHHQKEKLPGWEKGEADSYVYVPLNKKFEMHKYVSIRQPMWGREFPVGWRDIDHDLPTNATIKAA